VSNRFIPIPVNVDQSQQTALINKNFAELDQEGTKKLYYDRNGVPSIFIGIDGTGKSVIQVAKDGKNVITATNDELTFNSTQNSLKIVSKGTTTVTASDVAGNAVGIYQGGGSLLVPHGQAKVPIVLAYVDFGGYSIQLPGEGNRSTTSTNNFYGVSTINFSMDSTNINFFVRTTLQIFVTGAASVTGGPYPITYYVLQETIN